MCAINNLIIFTIIVQAALAHPDGAPLEACTTMTPRHGSTQPQAPQTAKHDIKAFMNGGNSVEITIASKPVKLEAFKGFFLQARNGDNSQPQSGSPVGTWDLTSSNGMAKGVSCSGMPMSAVTHVDNKEKTLVNLRWTPPPNLSGSVVFVATVVQQFDTLWVGLQSTRLDFSGGTNKTSPVTTNNMSLTGLNKPGESLAVANNGSLNGNNDTALNDNNNNNNGQVSGNTAAGLLSLTNSSNMTNNNNTLDLGHPLGFASKLKFDNNNDNDNTRNGHQKKSSSGMDKKSHFNHILLYYCTVVIYFIFSL